MKNLGIVILFLVTFSSPAQVGIGNSEPMAQLDIVATNVENPSIIDGILIPRVHKFPAENPGTEQHGMMVFLAKNIAGFGSGFYYWNASETKWKPMISDASSSNFYKPGTTSSPNSISENIFREASVGIGTETISSRLQIAIQSGKDLSLKKALEVDNANSATDCAAATVPKP